MTSNDSYTVGEVARIARVTIRTLHHYDAIGLLKPSRRGSGDYRRYTRRDLERLQQIRLYRDLRLPLGEIGQLLDDSEFDSQDALRAHRARLMAEIDDAQGLIQTIDRMIQGDETMTAEEMFDGFDSHEFADEAKERWGNTEAFATAKKRVKQYKPEDMAAIQAEHQALLEEFAAMMHKGESPTSKAAIALAERARLHIDRWYYPLSHSAHRELGKLYTSDPKFEATYQKIAPGLAKYVARAIEANAESQGGV